MATEKQLEQIAEKMIEDKFESLYLSYVNDFITVKAFAEHYRLSEKAANIVIEAGREINHARSAKNSCQ